jgi:potassium efflux system protein
VPLIFLTALNGLNNVPWAHRESLGRLLFILAMIVMAVFLAVLLRRRSPLMQQRVVNAPRSLLAGTHGLWLAALVAFPLAIAALAMTGYFVVAAFFFGRMLLSSFLVLGAVALYGLMALWVQVRRFELTRRQHEEAARLAAAEVESGAGGEATDMLSARADLATIGEQTRSLLDLMVTTLLLAGLWWVWKDALPNLSVVGDYPLWSITDTVEGKQLTRQLTLNRLLLAVIAAVVTVIVVRNVGALLDIALLQRFDMRADATYAVKVVARYAVAAAGILMVSGILSIEWSDAQWLIAALGVGLGFGLQEIVANFVSGLIVLAERPVRIGDTITVGNITGKVLGIKARATVVLDGDSREVIIPNKGLITERVVNWTLSDKTSRLLLKVRVARGADVALAQRVLLDVVQANPDVMRSPAPSVFFVGIGDNELDFEIRACVDSLDKRLRVQHELYAAAEHALNEHDLGLPIPQREPKIGPPASGAAKPAPGD